VIHYISGAGSNPVSDGAPANSTYGFAPAGIHADSNGDLYATDQTGNTVWKLVLNSPSGLVILSGNNQTGASGADLPLPLKVQVNGRAGVPGSGATVNYAVTSGGATLSAGTAQTDENGAAAVTVKLGAAGARRHHRHHSRHQSERAIQPHVDRQRNLHTRHSGDRLHRQPHGLRQSRDVQFRIVARDQGDESGHWSAPVGGQAISRARTLPPVSTARSVTVDGKPAFVYYISGTQVNVQAPADAATGSVPVTVTNCAGTSASVAAQKAALAAGILAPASFNVGGKQYAVAQFDDLTFVGNPNLIAGAAFRPAKPGDSIVIYGIGFGEVTPPSAPGVIVAAQNQIDGLTIAFGNTPATIAYGGLSPGVVGLFQFNVTVPDIPDGDSQIHFNVRGTSTSQTLYLTVKR
jgi:uncharacterized protein (TIGR03437 family)